MKLFHSSNGVDYILSFAAFVQSPLVILQAILIGPFHVPAETTTTYRVMLTAIPVIIGLFFAIKRNFGKVALTYLLAILFLLFTLVFFPENYDYLIYESARFTLPVVIPCFLCAYSVRDFDILEKTSYILSWLTFLLVLFYMVTYLLGWFFIDKYDMSFSYGALLPMILLYSRKSKFSVCASLLIFIIVLAIGSRGAFGIFLMFLFYDLLKSKSQFKYFVLVILGGLFFAFFFLDLQTILDNIGLSSRTLNLILSGNLDSTSGRDVIYEKMLMRFYDHPLWGIGFFGDRYYLDGSYCHNILLELFLNWGLLAGLFIFLYIIYIILFLYFKLCAEKQYVLMAYTFSLFLPLVMSGSYLTSYNFGTYIGVVLLLRKCRSGYKY